MNTINLLISRSTAASTSYIFRVGCTSSIPSRSFISRLFPTRRYCTNNTDKNNKIFGDLIHAIKRGSEENVEKAWIQLKNSHIKPDYRSYEMLIEFYSNKREWIKARELMNDMTRSDPSFKPNARIYSFVINGILHSKREYSRQVSAALNEVKNELAAFTSQLKTNNDADIVKREYYHLIVTYARLLQVDKAVDLFNEFEKRFGPDVFVFNGLLKAFVHCHKINELKTIFNERLLNNQPMNTISYNIAIEMFCKSGLIDDALSLFEQMKSKNMKPDEATYAVLLDGLGFANKFKKVDQIYQESKLLIGLSVNVASSLLEAAARCKEFTAGFRVVDVTSLPKLDHKFVRTFFQCVYRNLDSSTRPTPPFNWHNKAAKSELERPLPAVQEQQFIQFWAQCKELSLRIAGVPKVARLKTRKYLAQSSENENALDISVPKNKPDLPGLERQKSEKRK